MANLHTEQAFYSLTLEPNSFPTAACICRVIPDLKAIEEQIVEARGSKIYLRRLNISKETGVVKLDTVLEEDTFSIVRAVGAYRVPGVKQDFLTVTSDSGRVCVLKYDPDRNRFEEIKMETFGKSGVRRTVPGQYLATDPKGRCLMMASIERSKVAYIFQRATEGSLIISSPLEANQHNFVCEDLCALDTGWETPIFASLETNYEPVEKGGNPIKMLRYHTVELSLNHIAKSWKIEVDPTANKLFTVPGSPDGPSGVLVCAQGFLYWTADGGRTWSIRLPERQGPVQAHGRVAGPDGRIDQCSIVAGTCFSHKGRGTFFFLLQTDEGDVFKLHINTAEDQAGRKTQEVVGMSLMYYDTLPVARSMMLIKRGYLYLLAESGASMLYHVDSLGDDPSDVVDESSGDLWIDEDEPDPIMYWKEAGTLPQRFRVPFLPRRELKHLTETLTFPALHPLTRTKVDNLTGEDMPQIYALQGKGDKSVFKTTRHGMSVEELVSSAMGNVPYDQIFTMKRHKDDEYHYFVLLSSSYTDRSTVLGIGEEVETLDDTKFLTSRATIMAAQMGEGSHVQVHARGVQTIHANGQVVEWNPPTHRTIVAGCANQGQLLLGLSSGELVFFYMDNNGRLSAFNQMPEMSGRINAMGIADAPEGRAQARYCVVGCDDNTVRVLSAELDSALELRSIQGLSANPSSIEVVTMSDPETDTPKDYVHIGLKSGVYLRAVIDEATGELMDVRSKFLGSSPVRIFPVEIQDQKCVMCCSSRPWIGFHHPVSKQYTMTPLISGPLTAARGFVSEHLTGLCGIAESELRIFSPPQLGERFVSEDIQLPYTPRNMVRNPWYPVYYVISGDSDTMTKKTLKAAFPDRTEEEVHEEVLGLPKAKNHWASAITAIDPVTTKSITDSFFLDDNEMALCCACVPFEAREWEVFLVVGTGQDMTVTPGREDDKNWTEQARGGGYLHIYCLKEEGRKIEFVHKTRFSEPIHAIHAFKGRVLVGIGNELFAYDIGSKAMMRKTRGAKVANRIISIDSMGERICVGDVAESVTYIVYKPKANRLIPFADDTVQRWITTANMIDYDTVAGGDKFGNMWLLHVPEQAGKEADEDGMNGFIVNERSFINGAPNRLDLRAHIFLNDIPTSVQRTNLVAGGQEVLFWSGISGTLGMLVPFVTRDDMVFFRNLEMAMRSVYKSATGRDHLMYRGYYVPVKGVIDGDLCEKFLGLTYDQKQEVAVETEKDVKEAEKKVMEMRTRVAF